MTRRPGPGPARQRSGVLFTIMLVTLGLIRGGWFVSQLLHDDRPDPMTEQHTVRIEVTASGPVTRIQVIGGGPTIVLGPTLPWSREFSASGHQTVDVDATAHVSADLVTCRILVDGRLMESTTSSGSASCRVSVGGWPVVRPPDGTSPTPDPLFPHGRPPGLP
jgi:hypothetical protein